MDLLDGGVLSTEPIGGYATGNGFEHLDPSATQRVTAVDINPHYLEVLEKRFGSEIPGLQLICDDLATCELEAEAYDLVYCALIFEYLEPRIVIEKIAIWLRLHGRFVAVLQLPSKKQGKISVSEFKSLENLGPMMKLVAPEYLQGLLDEVGFTEIQAGRQILMSEKEFFIGHYLKGSL